MPRMPAPPVGDFHQLAEENDHNYSNGVTRTDQLVTILMFELFMITHVISSQNRSFFMVLHGCKCSVIMVNVEIVAGIGMMMATHG